MAINEEYRIRSGIGAYNSPERLPMWVKLETFPALTEMSDAGGRPDVIRTKTDIGQRMLLVPGTRKGEWGRPDDRQSGDDRVINDEIGPTPDAAVNGSN